jgi:hypothetical protein
VNGAGNSTSLLKYSYTDKNPYSGVNYYRLRQVDFDGRSSLSKIEKVNISSSSANEFVIYPNPTTGYIQVGGNWANSSINLQVSSINGKILFNDKGSLGKLNEALKKQSSALSPGTYVVKLVSGNNVWSTTYIKQ